MDSKTLNTRLPYAFGNEIEYLQELGSGLPDDASIVMLGIGPAVLGLALLEGTRCSFTFTGVDIADFTGVVHLLEEGYKINAIHESSALAAGRFTDNSVDFLIVDACHTYPCVSADIAAWWDKVKIGGLVFFHDYVPQDTDAPDNGVAQAVEEYRNESWQEIARPGCSIVFRKLV